MKTRDTRNKSAEQVFYRQQDKKAYPTSATVSSVVKNPRKELSESGKVNLFREAWGSVATRGLSRRDRVLAQRSLLECWAEVDLRGAMKAVLAESWQYEEGLGGEDPAEGSLAPALAKAFTKDPVSSWLSIESGEFGLGAGMFRKVWFRSVGQSESSELAMVVGEVSGFEREAFFAALENGVLGDPEAKNRVMAELLKQSEASISAEELLAFQNENLTNEELWERMEETDYSGREGDIVRLQYAKAFQEYLQGVTELTSVTESLDSGLESLPKEQRGKFVYEIAKGYRYQGEGEEGERKMLACCANER